jgi:phospholipid/cholesterol/gamma-HCH transport system substrate-binding protein
MAQRKELSWSELRVGLFVLAALFILGVALIWVTGGGNLSPKYTLKTYLPEVQGVAAGAPVRLDGVEIGNVDAIRMNPHPSAPSQNIELVLRVNKKFQTNIRSDSVAQLITEGLLGNRYVSIKRGFAGQEIPNGGVVPGSTEESMKDIVQRGAEVAQNLDVLSKQLGEIVEEVHEGRGTIGKLLTDQTLYNHMNDTLANADEIITAARNGQGTVGKLLVSDELYNKVNASAAQVDAVLTDIRAQKGTLGKFIYDPAVYDNARTFLDRGNAFFADVQAGKGTLGKLAADETLYNNLRDASANVKEVTAKLNTGQGTLGRFFSDPQFYDNATGLSGDLRLLIGDFRKNPKKFLHVKLSVF